MEKEMISSSATNAHVDILNTFKKNRKDFFGEKMTVLTNGHQCQKSDKIYNSLIISTDNIFGQGCQNGQNCQNPEKSNNLEKNRTILEGETFCGSFDHFLYYS